MDLLKKQGKGHRGRKTAKIIDFLSFALIFKHLTNPRYSGITYEATQSIDKSGNTKGISGHRHRENPKKFFIQKF